MHVCGNVHQPTGALYSVVGKELSLKPNFRSMNLSACKQYHFSNNLDALPRKCSINKYQ